MSNKTTRYLVIIVLIGLALRLIGITNGFPFIFHPDEPTIVRSALGVRFFWNPGHFDWPHLYIYLNYFTYMVFAKLRDFIEMLGYKEYTLFWVPLLWNDNLIFYLITRILTAIIGALTIIPLYLTGKEMFNKKVGIYAAIALAITPFHIWYSHYSLADVPMMFFVAWVVFFSSRILFKKDLMNYMMAGFFLGLAATTKYNGGLALIAIILAHFIRAFSEKDEKIISLSTVENFLFAGLFSIFAFILGTPYALFDYQTFLRTDGPKGALWQFTNVGKVPFVQQIMNFFEAIAVKLSENMGYTLIILFVAAFIYVVVRMVQKRRFFVQKDLMFLTLTSLFLIFYISGAEKDRAHYFFVAYPTIILAGVGFLWIFLDRIKIKRKFLIWGLVFVLPLYFSVIAAYTFYKEDTRVLMYKWLLNHTTSVTNVYFEGSTLDQVKESLGRPGGSYTEGLAYPKGSLIVMTGEKYKNGSLLISFENRMRKGPVVDIYLVD